MSELAQLGVGRDRRLEAVVGWRGGVIGGSGPAVVIMGCVAHHLRARGGLSECTQDYTASCESAGRLLFVFRGYTLITGV